MVRHSFKTGLSFGLTSAIITTLGLIVGLHSGTHSKLAVIGGVLIIAIADAFSDALGIHISEESEGKHTPREIWEATLSTFFSKFVFALVFIVPLLIFSLQKAIVVSIILGLSLLGIFSFKIAEKDKIGRWSVVVEHMIVGLLVIFITHFIGEWISFIFS